jgi:hypothetical protein
MIEKLIFTLFLLFTLLVKSQSDTLIGETTYKIIERHQNGKIKQVGQFAADCENDVMKKHGYFITYNEKGGIVKQELYFYNERQNRKILGLKHGWWGFYGMQKKYFLGITRAIVIVDPCF